MSPMNDRFRDDEAAPEEDWEAEPLDDPAGDDHVLDDADDSGTAADGGEAPGDTEPAGDAEAPDQAGGADAHEPDATDDETTDIQATDSQATDTETTGNDVVDDVLASMRTLDERPVDEHVAVFEQAQERLRGALDDPRDS